MKTGQEGNVLVPSWCPQAITWTNVDLLCDITQELIWNEILKIWMT